MTRINENFLKLKAGYLFREIGRRVSEFTENNPDADVIKLGIGDVTEPLVPEIVRQMHAAVDEMAQVDTFHGYGPEKGYSFLTDAILDNDYRAKNIDISDDEIFISDGSKCDTGNFQEIFDRENTIAVTDPVYPVYVDTNVMAGRTGQADDSGRYEGIVYLPCTAENDFVPDLPSSKVDLIYLCYPNNPTGAVATRDQLAKWVEYARENDAIILFDAAYEAFITDPAIPHSIYEIPGADEVAVEFRSFSKTAGFTGVRCAFTIVPHKVKAVTANGEKTALNPIWNRRHGTKFNGVSYITQKGAAAVYTPTGRQQVQKVIQMYLANAGLMKQALSKAGIEVHGGENAPYVWLRTPDKMDSWEFFDYLLEKANIVGTPGAGFGAAGQGYFRLSAFNHPENVKKAMDRISAL